MKRDITFYHAGIAIEMEHDVPVKISCPVCGHKVEGGFDEAFLAFVPHFDTHTQEERSATDVIGAAYKRRYGQYDYYLGKTDGNGTYGGTHPEQS